MAIPPGLLQGIERLDPLPVTLQRLVRAVNDEHMGPFDFAGFSRVCIQTLVRLNDLKGSYGTRAAGAARH